MFKTKNFEMCLQFSTTFEFFFKFYFTLGNILRILRNNLTFFTDNWLKCLEESRHWFLNEGSLKVQDSKRKQAKPTTNKPTTYEDTQDSFKNFCVD